MESALLKPDEVILFLLLGRLFLPRPPVQAGAGELGVGRRRHQVLPLLQGRRGDLQGVPGDRQRAHPSPGQGRLPLPQGVQRRAQRPRVLRGHTQVKHRNQLGPWSQNIVLPPDFLHHVLHFN